jgi:HSP20 family protein
MEQKLTIHKNNKNRNHLPTLSSFLKPPVEFTSMWNPARLEPFWWSNDIFDAARRNMGLVFDEVFKGMPIQPLQPYADVTEDQKSVRIKMDVPGLDADDIDISTDGGMLTISADKQEKEDGTESRYSFSYTTVLPDDAHVDQADVNFANHRLSIEIPKRNGVVAKPAVSKTKHGKHKKARR